MEKEISKVIAFFTDGTQREIDKGAVIGIEYKGDEVKTRIELIDCAYADIVLLVCSIVRLADDIGILRD